MRIVILCISSARSDNLFNTYILSLFEISISNSSTKLLRVHDELLENNFFFFFRESRIVLILLLVSTVILNLESYEWREGTVIFFRLPELYATTISDNREKDRRKKNLTTVPVRGVSSSSAIY